MAESSPEMLSEFLGTPLSGQELKNWIDSPKPKRETIAEGLLYEKSCIMIASDPGLGKSCISLQAGLELSCGVPLFGVLPVSKPCRVYYIMKERPKEEAGERIEEMQKTIPWNPDNFCLDDKMQLLNLCKEQHQRTAVIRIEKFKPDIIFFDPLYGGMTSFDEEAILRLSTFFTHLQSVVGAIHWLNHHTVKSKIDHLGNVKDDPFYGSQFLKAHITGSYHMKKGKAGIIMSMKKNSHSNLIDTLEFEYDDSNYTSRLISEKLPTFPRFCAFISTCFASKRTFKIPELSTILACDRRTCYRLIDRFNCHTPFSTILVNLNPTSTESCYSVQPRKAPCDMQTTTL